MAEDNIRERHGMQCRDAKQKASTILVEETDAFVWIDGNYEPRGMTPTQARYLARKLYRLARRIDARQGEAA